MSDFKNGDNTGKAKPTSDGDSKKANPESANGSRSGEHNSTGSGTTRGGSGKSGKYY